VEWFFNGVA